ncbi:hypothetical protein OTB20_39500 [Streptomyces sp. H27-H1]|uniref:hypothetical protein n=1 Tax=Streptomyces sp. H27-H1 TaxID=2996461 RepID=UPI00226EAE31|nr:hypothetical protein [Streptomyces sp. H27-H1]MCY0932149.1 hypothetical protein [Streptomyces sp. H27-H1]
MKRQNASVVALGICLTVAGALGTAPSAAASTATTYRVTGSVQTGQGVALDSGTYELSGPYANWAEGDAPKGVASWGVPDHWTATNGQGLGIAFQYKIQGTEYSIQGYATDSNSGTNSAGCTVYKGLNVDKTSYDCKTTRSGSIFDDAYNVQYTITKR